MFCWEYDLSLSLILNNFNTLWYKLNICAQPPKHRRGKRIYRCNGRFSIYQLVRSKFKISFYVIPLQYGPSMEPFLILNFGQNTEPINNFKISKSYNYFLAHICKLDVRIYLPYVCLVFLLWTIFLLFFAHLRIIFSLLFPSVLHLFFCKHPLCALFLGCLVFRNQQIFFLEAEVGGFAFPLLAAL